MPLERNPVSLPALAHSIIDEMRAIADREMVTLQLQAVSGVPLVFADDDLIRRVFVNLIDNALKHSPRNSTVTVKIVPEPRDAAPHRFSFPGDETTEEGVRCAVMDMGPGIPTEFRDRVFERFAQLDGRRTGKGLGLAFCRLAVQAHGGHIWIEDNPRGKGSAFVFTLPAAKPELLPSAHA
jgi:signal transduction histidine kinase